jgi:hypothetical protein
MVETLLCVLNEKDNKIIINRKHYHFEGHEQCLFHFYDLAIND